MNDLWSEWQARIDAAPEAALCALPASLPDAASIPPREWLYARAYPPLRQRAGRTGPGGQIGTRFGAGRCTRHRARLSGERVHHPCLCGC